MNDSCPNCGYRKEPYLMASSNRDDLSLTDIWSGAAGIGMEIVLKLASLVCAIMVLAVIIHFMPS